MGVEEDKVLLVQAECLKKAGDDVGRNRRHPKIAIADDS